MQEKDAGTSMTPYETIAEVLINCWLQTQLQHFGLHKQPEGLLYSSRGQRPR